jgi:peroxiredoxin
MRRSARIQILIGLLLDFTLQYFNGSDRKDVHLSDYRGKKNVVLAFYIFAFTGG